MKFCNALIQFLFHRLILIGIFLGILSWIVESFIHSRIFYDQNAEFLDHLVVSDFHELWMRLTIVTLFISFAVYAQRIVKALRKAEHDVRQINMELIQIFETSADGMRVIDKDFNTLRVNKTFLELAGVSRQGIEKRKCYEIFRGATCHTDDCPMLRIRRGEGRIEYDALKIRQDGKEIPCIVTATPFYDSVGHFIGIVEDFKDISDRKRTEKELKRSHEQLRNVASHLEMAREQERRAMAREIHDELGQSLTGLKMDIHWLSGRLTGQPENINEKLRDMNQQLDNTVHTVQRLSSELRPCLLDDLGLSAAIEWHANTVRDRLGIAIDVVSTPEDITLDESYSITVYRIFQEALTNIARHSDATEVEIQLDHKNEHVNLTVKDNGKGITREQIYNSNSLGLIGMHERAGLLNGSLNIQSAQGLGTTVSLSIPYPKNERQGLAENSDRR
ncbi:MAG: PAS domain-containing sensor histidine kinase [Desulfobulbaceae bacterium]